MSRQLFICTDLDRTLIPNGPQPESPLARQHFAALVGQHRVCLAYVSGRHRELVEEAIADYALPVPDFVIGDVGTTIYRVGCEHLWQYDKAWEEEIARDWAGCGHAGLHALLADVAELELQEAEKQNRCKLSYYMPVQADKTLLLESVATRLARAGVHFRTIWSIDEQKGIGLLDILPERASKLHAIMALLRQNGFDLEHTVFCGDSGNDIDVMASPVPSVLVANSSDEVRAQAIAGATAAGHAKSLYIAKGGLMGMNGNYAAGMLEGIVHFHPEVLDWVPWRKER
jgi:sucrose-6-phosphatase